jgi:hypothetical protein
MSETHAVNRTSPKGQPFIGTCMKCGKTGLTLADSMREECENPSRMTDDESLVAAIEGADGPLYELECHATTARKLLDNPEWVPSRLLWHRLTAHLETAVRLAALTPKETP